MIEEKIYNALDKEKFFGWLVMQPENRKYLPCTTNLCPLAQYLNETIERDEGIEIFTDRNVIYYGSGIILDSIELREQDLWYQQYIYNVDLIHRDAETGIYTDQAIRVFKYEGNNGDN